jgi:uncharacterized protein YkwD
MGRMKNRILIPLIISLLVIFFLSCEKKDEIKYEILEDFEQEIVDLINQHRDSVGLDEMVVDEIIRREARNHSINIATEKVPFGHEGYQQRAEIIFSEVGGSHFGENVASGNYPDAEYFIESWLNSPDHKANLEGDFNYTGVGVAEIEGGYKYCTQIFLKK